MNQVIFGLCRHLRAGLAVTYGRRLKGLFLFGSYARGDARADSDLDVLVVLDRIERYGAEIDLTGDLASRFSLEYGVTISRVFISEEDWKGRDTPFLQQVRREAVAV